MHSTLSTLLSWKSRGSRVFIIGGHNILARHTVEIVSAIPRQNSSELEFQTHELSRSQPASVHHSEHNICYVLQPQLVYRGHHRALCFPARDYLPDHQVHRTYLK